MKRLWFADVAALTVLLVTIAFFFLPLFYPEPRLIVTPDFGRSDAWHFSFPTKYALSQSLRRGELPLWVPEMGRGFPLLAEGQIGALFLPNLVLFKFFDPVTAYNLALVLAVITLGISMYWWMRLLPISRLSALFAGLTLAFSGVSILQLPHISLLQGFSLFPAVAAATNLLANQPIRHRGLKTTVCSGLILSGAFYSGLKSGVWRRRMYQRSRRSVALLSLILAQQVLTGFPQASFITVLFCGAYLVFLVARNEAPRAYARGIFAPSPKRLWRVGDKYFGERNPPKHHPTRSHCLLRRSSRSGCEGRASTDSRPWYSAKADKNRWSLFGQFILAGILALGLSAIQLLPSLEFLRLIINPTAATPDGATSFSFPIKHLLTFLNPFALGNPQNGIYPPFWEFDGSIFWENTGYLGLVPLLLAVWPVLGKRHSHLMFLIAALIGSFLLMTGKYSPVYFVHSLWPFSLFRVPSRFIWPFTVSLIVLAALGIEKILKMGRKKLWPAGLIILLITGNLVTFWRTWGNYHALAPAQIWLTPPAVISSLSQGRLLTIGDSQIHNRFFLKSGWQDIAPFVSLREVLAPNSNILWHVPQVGVYAGRQLRRGSILDSLLVEGIEVGEKQATVSGQAVKFMSLLSVRNIISALAVNQENLILKGKINDDPLIPLTLLENQAALPRAYMTHIATVAATLREAVTILKSDLFIPGETVLLEEANLNDSVRQVISTKLPKAKPAAEIEIVEDKETVVSVAVRQNPAPGFLVLTDTWYPGWQATLDGTPTLIFPANLAQRAVFIPEGNHDIQFWYKPTSFSLGAKISAAALVITVFLVGAPFLGAAFRTRKKAAALGPHRRHTRGK